MRSERGGHRRLQPTSLVFAAVVVAIVALPLAPVPQAALAVEALEVSPNVVPRGASVSVTGTTLSEGASVRISLDGADLGEVRVRGRTFSMAVEVERDIGLGQHTITACETAPVVPTDPTPTETPTPLLTSEPTTEPPVIVPTTEPPVIPTTEPPVIKPTTELPVTVPTDPPVIKPTTELPVTVPTDPPVATQPPVDQSPSIEPPPPTATDVPGAGGRAPTVVRAGSGAPDSAVGGARSAEQPAGLSADGPVVPARTVSSRASRSARPAAVTISTQQVCASSASAAFTVVNRPPLAEDDLVATLRDTPVRIELTANDRDPDGDDGVPESTTITRPPEHGKVEPLGEAVVLYTPAAGFVGADGLGYRLCESGDCAFAQVSVVVEDDAVLQAVLSREETPEDVLPLVALPELGGSPATNPSYVSPDRVAAQQARCSRSPLAWGGHGNGRIPPDQLASIGGGHLLETTAAGRFQQLRSAAASEGVTVGITDSYRSYAGQVEVRLRKGYLVATATPGTSVHGWAKALDLVVRDAAVRAWLERNAARFGWINPPWAKRPGKSFEPWHYEFFGGATGSSVDPCGGEAAVGPVNKSADAPPDPVAAAIAANPAGTAGQPEPGGSARDGPAPASTPSAGAPAGDFAPALVGISRWNQVGIGLGALAAAAAALLWGWDARRGRGS